MSAEEKIRLKMLSVKAGDELDLDGEEEYYEDVIIHWQLDILRWVLREIFEVTP